VPVDILRTADDEALSLFEHRLVHNVLTLDDLIRDEPKFIETGPGELEYEGLSPEILRFIEKRVDRHSHTLETGSGASTVLFVMKQTRHIAITPDRAEVERVTTYCRDHGMDPKNVSFIVDCSEHALPQLDLPMLDMVVIDGRHGFPAPYIDWYYTAPKLKLGGLLIVDDTWIYACQILRDFLAEALSGSWSMIPRLARRCLRRSLREVTAGNGFTSLM
jgi:hypothetical protein